MKNFLAESLELKKRNITSVYFDITDSTNIQARAYASRGEASPALLVADTQTAGRGRLGRSFYSPPATGLYMTLLMDVTQDEVASVSRITSAVAVAAVKAIREVTGIECRIKWVNDLYFGQKKACGILAESFFVGDRRFVCIGIGVNLTTKDFPEELRDVAVSLMGEVKADLRCKLAEALAVEIYDHYSLVKCGELSYMEDYRRLSLVTGRAVRFTRDGVTETGVALDIDADGGLIVRRADGETVTLVGGEITLRFNDIGELNEQG